VQLARENLFVAAEMTGRWPHADGAGTTLEHFLEPLTIEHQPGDRDYNEPTAIEVTVEWPELPPGAEQALLEKARFATLSSTYRASVDWPASSYARVIVRPADRVAGLAHLVAATAITQLHEHHSLLNALGMDRPDNSPPSAAEYRAAHPLPAEFSLNQELDQHEQRWRSAGHEVIRRGEFFRLFARFRPPMVLDGYLGEHPGWGPGLLLMGHVPGDFSSQAHESEALIAAISNDDRLGGQANGTDLLGAWCTSPDEAAAPTFVSFVPEDLLRRGVAARAFDQSLGRFDWLGRSLRDATR
jgi:hypothetical protein